MEIVKAAASLGALVTGIDLARPLADGEHHALIQAFAEHQVLSFPDQRLSPEQLLDVARYFGDVAHYPYAANLPGHPGVTEVIKREDDTVNFGGVWHSDTTYTPNPPVASMLYSRELPELGGDTLFSSMYAAWDALSDGMQAFLKPLNAVNTSALRSASGTNMRFKFKRSMAVENTDRPDLFATHPVVRVHPVTGRSALYINSAHTKQFEGMSESESAPILKYLYGHLKNPEFGYRLNWQQDMVTVWDNRCTQHYALNDYHGHRRVMHRVTIVDPVNSAGSLRTQQN